MGYEGEIVSVGAWVTDVVIGPAALVGGMGVSAGTGEFAGTRVGEEEYLWDRLSSPLHDWSVWVRAATTVSLERMASAVRPHASGAGSTHGEGATAPPAAPP